MGMFKKDKTADESHGPRLVWGLPSRCPACAQPGYLDRVDLVDKVMYQHCPWCMTHWQTTELEILAAERISSSR